MTTHLRRLLAAVSTFLLVSAILVVGAERTNEVAYASTEPTVSSLNPTSGTASGGNDLTISGSGFGEDPDVVSVTVGGVTAPMKAGATFDDGTITVTLPARAGNDKTVGAKPVVVTVGNIESNVDKAYTYRPVLQAPKTGRVWLHDLASRSQRQLVTRTTSAPFLVAGTDALTGEPYLYETDNLYDPFHSATEGRHERRNSTQTRHRDAYQRESDERDSTWTNQSTPSPPSEWNVPSAEVTGLKSSGNCNSGGRGSVNTFESPANSPTAGQTIKTYCSIFGPEVYTESFYAVEGQSLSFDWRARATSDDYEVYAFLVRVDDDSDFTLSTGYSSFIGASGRTAAGFESYVGRHTLVLHRMGFEPPDFVRTSSPVPADGLYRFRFVNGSYDATGRWALGAEMYIKNTILVGQTNSISVPALSDQIRKSDSTYDPYVFEVSATSGAAVAVTPVGNCAATTSHSGSITTVTVTNSGGLGDCTLRFSQGQQGEFAPAQDVTAKFTWLAAATVPLAPTITAINPGNQRLSISFLPPSGDGGAAISNYEYSLNNGSNWTTVSPASTASPILVTGLTNGTAYTVRLRAVNSVGAGAQSGSSVGTPTASAPGLPTGVSITPGNQQLSVSFNPPADDGGSAISNYEYSLNNGVTWTAVDPPSTTSPIVITGLDNGMTYQVRLRAVNSSGPGQGSAAVTGVPAIPPPPPTPAPAPAPAPAPPRLTAAPVPPPVVQAPLTVPGRTTPAAPAPPPVTVSGPVLRGNEVPTPPQQPVARVGDRDVPVSTQVNTPNRLDVRAGSVSLGVTIPQTVGGVRQQAGGPTELEVRSGGQTTLQGGGVLPGSTVQVFMPLQGDNSRQVAQIQAGPTGTFNGDAVFATQRTEAPLPIGRQVLQIVSVDDTGQQVVMEMAVVIAQPPPAPEFDRSVDALPQLPLGQSIATEAGLPVSVQVRAETDNRLAVIEADGWTMAIAVAGQDASVEETPDGGASLTFVRDEAATVQGSGFMPGTRADIWLFSDPTLLGSVTIDDNGEFNGEISVDGRVVTLGEHTLQLQGVGQDGYVRSANLGVLVKDAEAELATTADVAISFAWWFWIIGLAALIAIAMVAYWLYRRAQQGV